jgi:hypothetical protein
MSNPAKSSRSAAAAAKVGVHYIPFSPHDAEPTEVSVTRVRAGTVYAGPDAGNEVSLNEVASRKLLGGEYRVKPQSAAVPEAVSPETPAQPEAPAPEVKPEPQAEAQAPEPSANGKPAKAPKVKAPKAKAPPPACLCGCGATTGGDRFVAGHDAKLKSALLKAFRAEGLSAEQQALVEQLDWGRFLTPAPAGGASGPSALDRARAALARLTDEERAELLAEYAVPVKRI